MSAELEALARMVDRVRELESEKAALKVELELTIAGSKMMTVEETADLLRVSKATVYRWIKEKKIPAQPLPAEPDRRPGRGGVRIVRAELQRALNELRAAAPRDDKAGEP